MLPILTACWPLCSSSTSWARRSAAALGDRRWREVLESFHARVRREIQRFRGREIDTVGDRFLTTFTGTVKDLVAGSGLGSSRSSDWGARRWSGSGR
jgi:hypothetical protein